MMTRIQTSSKMKHGKCAFSLRSGFFSHRSFSSVNTPLYDVLVVGGGLVGASLVCALGSTPILKHLKIGVIDGEALNSQIPQTSFPDLRVSAINDSSKTLFEGT